MANGIEADSPHGADACVSDFWYPSFHPKSRQEFDGTPCSSDRMPKSRDLRVRGFGFSVDVVRRAGNTCSRIRSSAGWRFSSSTPPDRSARISRNQAPANRNPLHRETIRRAEGGTRSPVLAASDRSGLSGDGASPRAASAGVQRADRHDHRQPDHGEIQSATRTARLIWEMEDGRWKRVRLLKLFRLPFSISMSRLTHRGRGSRTACAP